MKKTVVKARNRLMGKVEAAATTRQQSLTANGSLEAAGIRLKPNQSINKLFSPRSKCPAGSVFVAADADKCERPRRCRATLVHLCLCLQSGVNTSSRSEAVGACSALMANAAEWVL